jgi:hypothetical protein
MARSRPQAVATDRLDAMLTRLKLPGVRAQLDTSFLSSQVETCQVRNNSPISL